MEYRKAVKGEIAAIMELVDRSFEEQGIPAKYNPIPEEKKPVWWCCSKEGKILAACALFLEEGREHMGRICVDGAVRGQGIGTALLKRAFEDIFSAGIEEVSLEARDATVHILKKFGAEITGERVLFFGDYITPVRLRKQRFEETGA